jgi:hypothetical protein
MGDAVFVQSDRVNIRAGTIGMVGLVAYTGGGQAPHLLQRLKQSGAMDAGRPQEVQVPTSLTLADFIRHVCSLEIGVPIDPIFPPHVATAARLANRIRNLGYDVCIDRHHRGTLPSPRTKHR